MSGIPRVTIHPGESFGVSFRYPSSRRPTGAVISSGTVAAEDLDTGVSTSSDVLQSTVLTVGAEDSEGCQLITAGVTGGGSPFDETEHKVTITSTLDNGDVFVDVFVLKVTDQVEDC